MKAARQSLRRRSDALMARLVASSDDAGSDAIAAELQRLLERRGVAITVTKKGVGNYAMEATNEAR